MGHHSQVGITATFSVDDYDTNVILKHEKTRKVKEDDRTNHIVTTEAQTGPVFLTYRNVPELDKIVNETVKKKEPLYDFTTPDGIKHTVWILPDEYNEQVVSSIAGVKNLYIADGHHRAASASRAQKVKKELNPANNGNEEYNYFLGVLFPANQLKILPYNRVIRDLNGLTKQDFMRAISTEFVIERTTATVPGSTHCFCMYLDKEWHMLHPRFSPGTDPIESLDVKLLQDHILGPVLGIKDPRNDKRIDFIGGSSSIEKLQDSVDSGTFRLGFSLYPTTIDQLMRVSDADKIMPPKSTWFEPKLRSGIVVHLLK